MILRKRTTSSCLNAVASRLQSTAATVTIDSSYLQNEGTIEGVWIFHRHGDRAPNRYLGSPAYQTVESSHWYSRIPPRHAASSTSSYSHYAALSHYFPPNIHPSQNNGNYLDVNREPYGYLTYRGMDQMRCVGKRFRIRCDRYGYRRQNKKKEKQSSFLEDWDVQAYSTNYLRTVTSVQCFLDGLIGSNNNTHNDSANRQKQQLLNAGGGLKRYYRDAGRHEHIDATTLTSLEVVPTTIPVQVRDKTIDTLNAFDKRPTMMNELVKNVIQTDNFQRIDDQAKALATQLSDLLPGLRNAPQAFGGTPSGINWIHANDHFVCRRAHGIPLTAFSDYEGSDDESAVETMLESLAIPVCSHLSWRFREWYACPKLVSAVAAPPFREILDQMIDVTTRGEDDDERRPFVVYSAHDVTLLALLYAIGADFLVSGEDCGGRDMVEGSTEGGGKTHSHMIEGAVSSDGQSISSSWRWWPDYSSAIAFELVRLNHGQEYGDTGHIIRVILNGRTLRLIPRLTLEDEGILKDQTPCSRQRFGEVSEEGQCQMLSLSDFAQIISVLEQSSYASSADEEDYNTYSEAKIGVEGG
ncbi:hypothetical protein ACHAWC_008527 [Mediolabrus comicus]